MKSITNKQKMIRVILVLGFICLLILTTINSIYVNPGDSIVYEIDNPLESYTFEDPYNVSRIIISGLDDDECEQKMDYVVDTWVLNAYDNVQVGQTFTVGTVGVNIPYTIGSAGFYAYRTGSPGTGNVNLYATSGGKPTGSSLASGTFNGNTLPTGYTNAIYVEVELSTPQYYRVTPNTQYAIVITASSGDGSNRVWIHEKEIVDEYAGGTALYSTDDGSSWSIETEDLFFRILGSYSYIVFNNTGFNISSGDAIDIKIKHIDEDIVGSSDESDLLLSFEVGNPASETWFNLSGFNPGSLYKIYSNAVFMDFVTANATGVISYYDIPSWNDIYTIYWTASTNSAPVLSLPFPANNSIEISASGSPININASDPDGDLMLTNMWTNASGSWVQVAGFEIWKEDLNNWSRRPIHADVNGDGQFNFQDGGLHWVNKGNQSNGTRLFVLNIADFDEDDYNFSVTDDWGMTVPDIKYWWSANVTDGEAWTNETYVFTTGINYPPNITKPFPPDGATGVNVTGSPININITDADGEEVATEVWTNASGTWEVVASWDLWRAYGENFTTRFIHEDANDDGQFNFQDVGMYWVDAYQPDGMRFFVKYWKDGLNDSVTDDWGMTEGNTKYWWQVRADDGNDTVTETYSFTTGVVPAVLVETNEATNVEEGSGILNGELTYDEDGNGCTVWFEYGTTLSLGLKTIDKTRDEGETFADVIGLQSGSKYFFRAVAENAFDVFYGDIKIFVSKPYAPTELTLVNLPDGFNVTWKNPYYNRWNNTILVYNIYNIPTSPSNGTILRNDSLETWNIGTVNSNSAWNHTGLTGGVTYYYSIWSLAFYPPIYQWSDGYDSASQIYIAEPNVTTDESVASNEYVTFYGNLLDDGGETCDVSFEYGQTDAFGIQTALQQKVTGDTFNQILGTGGLPKGQIYHYRAIANNSRNETYGDDMPFIIAPDKADILHVNNSWSPSTLNLTWTKGDGANNTYIERNTASSWDRGEGTLIYNNTGLYFNDTDLETGELYYYQAWGYAEWMYAGTNYWSFSILFDTDYNTTQTVDPPYNGSSSYDTTEKMLNLTWTSGNLSDYDIVVQNNNTWSTSPSDGWVRQNSTVNDSNYYNGYIDATGYFTVWSYNLTGNIYSKTGLNIPWGAMELNVFDENSPWIPVVNYTLFVTNADGDETYYLELVSNPQIISFDSIPFGEDTIIQINHPSYEQRVWHVDIYQNTYYNFTFYLPSIETPPGGGGDGGDGGDGDAGGDCVTRSYLDSVTITDPDVNAVITLTYTLTNIIEVHIFNASFYGDYGGWVPVSSDKFTATASTVTVDNSVLDINTTIVRAHYYYEDCDSYEPPALYYIRIVESYETDFGISDRAVENALVTFQRYINTTDSYEDISILLTDANGYVDLYLMPGVIYKVIITKDGYVTKSSSFQPAPPNEYGQTTEKVFRITSGAPDTDDPDTDDDNVYKNIEWSLEPSSVQQHELFTIWFNITSSDCKLEWYRMIIYYHNRSTDTWTELYNVNQSNACGGELNFTIPNVTGRYAIECFYKKTNFTEFECFQQGSIIMFFSNLMAGLESFPDLAYFIILIVIMICVMGFFMYFFATGITTGYIGLIVMAIGLLLKPVTIYTGIAPISGWLIFAVTFLMYTMGVYLWSKI